VSGVGPDRWRVLRPLLGQALDLPEDERAAWLATLRQADPARAAELQVLLDEHRALDREGFLDRSPALPGPAPPRAGLTVGAYTLVSPLGEGGMGVVWLAERTDGRFDRKAAVKFLSVALAGRGEERFRREGSLLARLVHPHIAQLLDAGVAATGQPYLVLEHIEGESIDQHCDRRALDVEARLRLFLDVLKAVEHAHGSLIVHRDLKPSNVLVTGGGQVKLLDFGIAKLLADEATPEAASALTREHGSALTPEFAAPEQLTGGPISTATDVYALGVLLFLLLTGTHPAGGGPLSPADIVRAAVDLEPPRPSDVVVKDPGEAPAAFARASRRSATPERLRRQLRGDLDLIVAKALRKPARERYVSVTAMADDLRRYLRHEPISVRPDTLVYLAAKLVRRNRAATTLAAVAFAAALAGVAGTSMQARTARAQREVALRQLSRAEAINDLNTFLLSDAGPAGRPFTVNDLLERAERILGRQQDKRDPDRLEILLSIGHQYYVQDEDARARRLLEEAYELTRDSTDRSLRARASCALATALARGDDLPRAEELLQEGLAEAGDDPQFTLDRVYCLLRGSAVARHAGDAQEGVVRIEAGLRLLQRMPYQFEEARLNGLTELAEALRVAGRLREASTVFEQSYERIVALGRDEAQSTGTLLNNWGLTLSLLGRPLDAEPLFRKGIDISRADSTEEAVSPMLLVNYARVLRDLARLDEAADYVGRGYAKARESDDQIVVNQALLLGAWIRLDRHELERAAAMLAEVEPRLRQALPAGHFAFASLASYQSLLARGRGDPQGALRLANEAVSRVEASLRSGGQGVEALPLMLVRRSDLELHLRQLDDAVADAGRAVALLEQAAPAGTLLSTMGRAQLVLGRALREQGRVNEAGTALRIAAEHLESALGRDHPEAVAARRLADPDPPPPALPAAAPARSPAGPG